MLKDYSMVEDLATEGTSREAMLVPELEGESEEVVAPRAETPGRFKAGWLNGAFFFFHVGNCSVLGR